MRAAAIVALQTALVDLGGAPVRRFEPERAHEDGDAFDQAIHLLQCNIEYVFTDAQRQERHGL